MVALNNVKSVPMSCCADMIKGSILKSILPCQDTQKTVFPYSRRNRTYVTFLKWPSCPRSGDGFSQRQCEAGHRVSAVSTLSLGVTSLTSVSVTKGGRGPCSSSSFRPSVSLPTFLTCLSDCPHASLTASHGGGFWKSRIKALCRNLTKTSEFTPHI